MAKPTKLETKRREAALKRVEDLLGNDVTVDIKKATIVADKLDMLESKGSSGSGNPWLESQVEELSKKNEELENQVVQAKKDYEKLLKSGKVSSEPVDVTAVESGVRKMFNELRNNYEGNNATKTKYTQANIRQMLEKFLGTFEFLRRK